jgi:hypothetical protein
MSKGQVEDIQKNLIAELLFCMGYCILQQFCMVVNTQTLPISAVEITYHFFLPVAL